MGNEIKPTGQGPYAAGAVSMPGLGQPKVDVSKGKKAPQSDAPVKHADKPIESREADLKPEPSVTDKIDKVNDILGRLQQRKMPEKSVDIAKVESELNELKQDFTMVYNVVDLMGDGEEVNAVKSFLNSILSVIKSLLAAIGLMKQVDAKGNLPPKQQEAADEILADAQQKMEQLNTEPKQKPKATAMPIKQPEQILEGAVPKASPPPPPPMPPVAAQRPKASSAATQPPAPPMPAPVAPAPAVVAKPERSALLAQIQAGKPLKKADPDVKSKTAEPKTFAQAALGERRKAIYDETEENDVEEFEDDFSVSEAPKASESKVSAPVTANKENVVRPKAAPQDLLAGLRKGVQLNKVKTDNRPPVKAGPAKSPQEALADSDVFKRARAESSEETADDDEWKD